LGLSARSPCAEGKVKEGGGKNRAKRSQKKKKRERKKLPHIAGVVVGVRIRTGKREKKEKIGD